MATEEFDEASGMRAHLLVYAWFMESTGLQLSERRAYLMRPGAVRHAEDMADVGRHGKDMKLS